MLSCVAGILRPELDVRHAVVMVDARVQLMAEPVSVTPLTIGVCSSAAAMSIHK